MVLAKALMQQNEALKARIRELEDAINHGRPDRGSLSSLAPLIEYREPPGSGLPSDIEGDLRVVAAASQQVGKKRKDWSAGEIDDLSAAVVAKGRK